MPTIDPALNSVFIFTPDFGLAEPGDRGPL